VHFAQPWVRPPPEVYGLVTTFLFDGVELVVNDSWKDWDMEFYGGIANAKFEVPRANASGTDEVDAYPAYLTVTFEKEELLFKLGYSTGLANFEPADARQVLDPLRNSPYSSFAQQLEIDNKRFHVVSLAAKYETPQWLLLGEYASRQLDGFFQDISGAYVTLGYHVNAWKPYVTYARRWSDGPKFSNPVPTGVDPDLTELSLGADQLMRSGASDSETISIGVTRAINDSMVLKFQLDWIYPDSHGNGVALFNSVDDYQPDDELLFSLNLDFVF
jgi:hypothetical protein